MSHSLRLLLTGDSILQRRLNSRDDAELRPLFDKVRAADVAFTNFEVLANDYRGDPALEGGGSHFGAPAWVLDELLAAGIDLFATATNHSLDYSISGLLASIEAMEARGVSFAGVGRNLEDARRPCYHTSPQGTVAMISCASTFGKGQEAGAARPDVQGRPGLNPLHFETVHEVTEQQLLALREVADQLGLEAERQQKIKMGFAFAPADPAVFPLGDLKFKSSNRAQVRTTANAKDIAAMVRWVKEARGLSDIVLVSLHAHEQMPRVEGAAGRVHRRLRARDDRCRRRPRGRPRPAPAARDGALQGQADLLQPGQLPRPERAGAEDSRRRLRAFPRRAGSDAGAGLPEAHAAATRRASPPTGATGSRSCRRSPMMARALRSIELTPISLGWKDARHRRGRPRLAGADEGRAILERFAALSQPFGTKVSINGASASVAL